LSLDQRQNLETLFARHPALQGVYELKERLFSLLCLKNQSPAQCRDNAMQLFGFIETLRGGGGGGRGPRGPTPQPAGGPAPPRPPPRSPKPCPNGPRRSAVCGALPGTTPSPRASIER
jgi:hypothetical protein